MFSIVSVILGTEISTSYLPSAFFSAAEAVEQAKAPMPELERLYREAVPEAVEYLGELYTLREGAYHLSKRWDRTYNG